jgi:hypothetical protein
MPQIAHRAWCSPKRAATASLDSPSAATGLSFQRNTLLLGENYPQMDFVSVRVSNLLHAKHGRSCLAKIKLYTSSYLLEKVLS